MSPSTATAPAPITPEPKTARPKPAPGKPSWQVVLLPVEAVAPSPYQPRLLFDEEEMLELVASVREHGVQQPILVRTRKPEEKAHTGGSKNGYAKNGASKAVPPYELVAGERRLRACREAGRRHIPAIVRDDLSDAQAAELALLENVQRSNLSVIEEARGYKQLMLKFRMKEERIAKKVGKSVATIQATMKLLQLPESVQQLLAYRKLTAAHGHALLPLAPHEQVCTLVAHHAATNAVTAASLSQTPLPNQQELKRKGLLQELDYRTKFDWRQECKTCPHKAYVASGYASYCLKPNEWKKKQEGAVELQKQEATRVMAAARQEGRTSVETGQLPPGSYRDLTHATLPSGCTSGCACRGESNDGRDPTRKVAVCLAPQRFSELVQAERQAHEEARRQRFLALWNQAKEVLSEERKAGEWHKIVPLLVLPVLQGHYLRYGDPEAWQNMAQQVGREVSISLPWEALFDSPGEQTDVLALLQEVEPADLLLFAACLLLAQEAREAVRFGGPTPHLGFVLGQTEAHQPELPDEEDVPDEEDYDPDHFEEEEDWGDMQDNPPAENGDEPYRAVLSESRTEESEIPEQASALISATAD